MPMMRRNTAVPRLILASADPDSISESGSSTSVPPPPPQPRRDQARSASQVASAVAPVAVEEVMVEGSGSSVVAGTALTRYLHQHGRIPLTRSAPIPDVDLNALLALPGTSRRPPRHVYRPVTCAYCNCAFCFGEDEVPSIDLGPGYVYPAPPVPITLNLLTPPAVWPLDRADPWGPGGMPEYLLVCSSEQHFTATMGMLQQQQPGGAPSLTWRCTLLCLRVLPVVVGTEGSNSPDLLACPAPPLEPWRYAGAYWNYVRPGDENMVQLKLHDDDPLELTLGRP